MKFKNIATTFAVGSAALVLVVGITTYQANASELRTSDSVAPGPPSFDNPSLVDIAKHRGISFQDHESAVMATIECLQLQGFDAYPAPGSGLRPSTISATVPAEQIQGYNVALGTCLAETDLSAIELAVAEDMEQASSERKEGATARQSSCLATQPADTAPEVADFNCVNIVWAETGLRP